MSAAPSRKEQALANYQAIQQHHFHSTVEKAMGDLLIALAEDHAAPSAPPELAAIRSELAALRRDLMLVSPLDSAAAEGSAEVASLRHEVASLRHEVAELARQTALGVVAPPNRAGARHGPRHLPGASAPMRPVEELLDEVPQIEAEVAPEQLKAYIQRPRVRPEDIALTSEDMQRQGRGGRLRASDEMRAKLGRQTQGPTDNRAGALLLIGVITLILLMCFAMMAGAL